MKRNYHNYLVTCIQARIFLSVAAISFTLLFRNVDIEVSTVCFGINKGISF